MYARALDTGWLCSHLPRYLHTAVSRVEICHRRESPDGLTLLYRIGDELWAGYCVAQDQLQGEFERHAAAAGSRSPAAPAVALVPEAGLILSAFPNDQALQPVSVEELVDWLRSEKGWELERPALEVLRYVPGQRVTARLSGLREGQPASWIVKQIRRAGKARRVDGQLAELRDLCEAAAVEFRLPRSLGCNPRRGFLVLEDLPGKPPARAMAGEVGRLLAQFQALPLEASKQLSPETELSETEQAARTIAAACPELGPGLDELLGRLHDAAGGLSGHRTLLHGSYRLNHLLADGSRLALIDLDGLRTGHPAYDLANFLASELYLEAQGRIDPGVRSKTGELFLDGYRAEASWSIPSAAVNWFMGSLLINKQALKYVKHLHKDRVEKIGWMLLRAAEALK